MTGDALNAIRQAGDQSTPAPRAAARHRRAGRVRRCRSWPRNRSAACCCGSSRSGCSRSRSGSPWRRSAGIATARARSGSRSGCRRRASAADVAWAARRSPAAHRGRARDRLLRRVLLRLVPQRQGL